MGVTNEELQDIDHALALLGGLAGQVHAADEGVATPSYADLGFYLRGDIGWSFLEWSGDDSNAFTGVFGVGYQFTDYLRSDLRVDYAGVYTNGPDMSVTTAPGISISTSRPTRSSRPISVPVPATAGRPSMAGRTRTASPIR